MIVKVKQELAIKTVTTTVADVSPKQQPQPPQPYRLTHPVLQAIAVFQATVFQTFVKVVGIVE
ncbi:MAG: hypothetical protein QW058_00595 [Candidatus Aenigmatarchaeota archaeon]